MIRFSFELHRASARGMVFLSFSYSKLSFCNDQIDVIKSVYFSIAGALFYWHRLHCSFVIHKHITSKYPENSEARWSESIAEIFWSDTQQSNTFERERNKNLSDKKRTKQKPSKQKEDETKTFETKRERNKNPCLRFTMLVKSWDFLQVILMVSRWKFLTETRPMITWHQQIF